MQDGTIDRQQPEQGCDSTGAPAWATAPFEEFLDTHDEEMRLLHLATHGISALRGMPRLVEALAEYHRLIGRTDTAPEERLEAARREAELAQRETERDFPALHRYALVSLWSSLETLVREFLVRWLRNYPGALSTDAVAKLRVRVGEYAQLDDDERAGYLVDLLEQELGASLRRGANRFETLLEPFGLSGPVSDPVGRSLYEMQQVRNVLVHRRGIADRKFREACPWINVSLGQPLLVSHEAFVRYSTAVAEYVTELIYRAGERFGRKVRPLGPGVS